MCFAPQRCAIFGKGSFQKCPETLMFFNILTWKCASRHSGVPFFDIPTPKSGPRLVCSVHFDLKMCFAPQRRAIFWHPNSQKWSENGVFYSFWLENVQASGSAPAALASLVFDPPDPQIIGDMYFVFSASFSLLLFSSLLFISPYCRKFDF